MRKELVIQINRRSDPCVLSIIILKQEGITSGFKYLSAKGIRIESAFYPEFSSKYTESYSPKFLVRGVDDRFNNTEALYRFRDEREKDQYIQNLFGAIKELTQEPMDNVFKRGT